MAKSMLAALAGLALGVAAVATPASADYRPEVPLDEFLLRPLYHIYFGDSLTARDMHLLGRVKESKIHSIKRRDDGTIELEYSDRTMFYEDGRVMQVEGENTLEPSIKHHWDYQYDADGRLVKISKKYEVGVGSKAVVDEFTHDSTGHLLKFYGELYGGVQAAITAVTVEITNLPDGRPKEAIAREGSGKAKWRVEYTYGDHIIAIQFFEDREEIKATFHIDDQNRPSSVEATSVLEGGTAHGTYRYSYQLDGRKTLDTDVEEVAGTPLASNPAAKCHEHEEYFATGSEDESKIRSECRGFFSSLLSYGLGGFGKAPEHIEYQFDKTGNLILQRRGKQAIELGRAIIRWNYEVTTTLTYY